MQSRTRTTICAVAFALVACAAIPVCEAADRFARSTDSGQPRELINQPYCCDFEDLSGLRRCDFLDQ